MSGKSGFVDTKRDIHAGFWTRFGFDTLNPVIAKTILQLLAKNKLSNQIVW